MVQILQETSPPALTFDHLAPRNIKGYRLNIPALRPGNGHHTDYLDI